MVTLLNVAFCVAYFGFMQPSSGVAVPGGSSPTRTTGLLGAGGAGHGEIEPGAEHVLDQRDGARLQDDYIRQHGDREVSFSSRSRTVPSELFPQLPLRVTHRMASCRRANATPAVYYRERKSAANQNGAGASGTRPRNNPVVLVPPELLLSFSMNGTIPLVYDFRDDRLTLSEDEQQGWTADLRAAATSASGEKESAPQAQGGEQTEQQQRRFFSKDNLMEMYAELLRMSEYPLRKNRQSGRYDPYHLAIVHLFAELGSSNPLPGQQPQPPSTKGKEVLVMGSLGWPIIEVAALTLGQAAKVTSVERRPIVMDDKRFETVAYDEFVQRQMASPPPGRHKPTRAEEDEMKSAKQYPIVVSYSVVQHEGLARYGDALDPFGDIEAMNELWALTQPGGILILAVSIGNDCLVFNTHRVYGRRRLPLLLYGFRVVASVGFDSSQLYSSPAKQGSPPLAFFDNTCPAHRLPILVLQRPGRDTVQPGTVSDFGWQHITGLLGSFPLYSHPRGQANQVNES